MLLFVHALTDYVEYWVDVFLSTLLTTNVMN